MRSFERVIAHGILVTCHVEQPDDVEWAEHLAFLISVADSLRGVLVVTETPITSSQRQRLTSVLRGRPPLRVAVVTSSALVRGVITALTWVGVKERRAFAPDDLLEAIAYLQVPSDERRSLAEIVVELCEQVLTRNRRQALFGDK